MRNAIANVFAAAAMLGLPGCDRSAAPSEPQSLRLQVDADRMREWTLTREGVRLRSAEHPAGIVIGLPGWTWAVAAYACPPDLALGPKGEAVITSNVVPTIWRVDPTTLAVSSHSLELSTDRDKDIGFSGLVYAAEQGAYFGVSDVNRSFWRIDPSLKSAQKVARFVPAGRSCPDLQAP